jgi:hypothetical protein
MKLCKILKKTKQAAYAVATAHTNKAMETKYRSVPMNKRLALVPHCLRNHEVCKAKDFGSYYICVECGKCKIAGISKKCKHLGYQGLYILKGGRTVEKLIEEHKPEAIAAIACQFEGAQGVELCKKHKVTVQFIPLSKDGCVNTDVSLAEVFETLEKK